MDERQLNALDILTVASFLIGAKNLQENREQSKYNDISAANEKQAEYLLQELTRKFEEQNAMLKEILEVLNGGRKEAS